MSLNSISLKAKLRVVFAALILLFAGTAYFAIDRLQVVDDSSSVIADRWLPRTQLLGTMNTMASDFRLGEARHLLTNDASGYAASQKMRDEANANLHAAAEKYAKLIRSENDKTAFVAKIAAWDQYVRNGAAMIAASAAGEKDIATKLFNESRPAFNALGENIQKTIDADAEKASKASADGTATYESSRAWLIGVGIFIALFACLMAVYFERNVAVAVVRLTDAMKKLADGDLKVEIPGTGRGDEIGAMVNSVEIFRQNAINLEASKAEQEVQKAAAEAEKRRSMNELADRFDATVKGVVGAVSSASTQLQGNAQSMSAISEETSRQAIAVASATEQASSNVQTVAAAAEELSSSINEISRQVAESSSIANQAVEEAQNTNARVEALAQVAQKIGDVVKLIQDIASQTNLLALNATIEAARAGEAGKGFAVVASEVKALANQTSKATEEIGAQIGAIQTEANGMVNAIQGIGQTIARINEIATTIAAAVEEQGAATQEIARNVQQAAAGTNEVSANIGGVTKAAEEAGHGAEQVLGAANELSQQSAVLSREIDSFITTIRAA